MSALSSLGRIKEVNIKGTQYTTRCSKGIEPQITTKYGGISNSAKTVATTDGKIKHGQPQRGDQQYTEVAEMNNP